MSSTPVAIISGAGSGVGRATALALSRRGYRLALFGRRIEPLNKVANDVSTEAIALAVDVTDAERVAAAVAEVVTRLGRVDAVVNGAGAVAALSVEDTTPPRWRELLDTNLSGAFYLSRAVWPIFRQQKAGVIVNVSSMAARDPFPNFVAYAAAKAGLNSLTLTLAKEGQPLGIAVHGIAPGAIETSMLRGLLTTKQLPESDALDPADVAELIVRCIVGELRHAAGETLYVQKRL